MKTSVNFLLFWFLAHVHVLGVYIDRFAGQKLHETYNTHSYKIGERMFYEQTRIIRKVHHSCRNEYFMFLVVLGRANDQYEHRLVTEFCQKNLPLLVAGGAARL